MWALVVVVVLFLSAWFASAFVPRWWAHRVGDQVNGSFTNGTLWGLFYGIVFTFIPLVVVRQAARRRFTWKTRLGIAVIALLLALPNLMTLGIVLGNGNAAHAGQRILDVDAPAFRGASLVGALVAAVGAVVAVYGWETRKRRGRELKALRTRARNQERSIERRDGD